MARTKDKTLLELVSRFRAAAEQVALEMDADDGNGMCISDVEFALQEFRGVLHEVETVAT